MTCGKAKQSHKSVTGVPEGEERREQKKNKEMMASKFANLMTTIRP